MKIKFRKNKVSFFLFTVATAGKAEDAVAGGTRLESLIRDTRKDCWALTFSLIPKTSASSI
jgi:hypothetical protein